MTRRPALLALFTLASATVALGGAAEAGGGVRLNFGGPLGTFVATPTPGYGGGSSYAAPRKAQPKAHTVKRAPVYTAERSKPKMARHIVPVRHDTATVTAKTIPVTADETGAPGLLGRTLALNQLPRAETVRILPPAESIVAQDGGEVETAKSAEAAKTPAVAKVAANTGPETCRKFIPAVGVTVTVACD